MMEIGSFTSEPQYQRPDDKNDMVHYIARPEPVQQPVVVPPVVAPVAAPVAWRYLDPNMARPLFNKFGSGAWIFNRLDFYGNSIILGSICNAIAFIIYGFYRARLYKVNDTFLWSVILLFGGLGQITAGFLEYCKGRSFPCTLYLCLGFYCLTHYAYFVIPSHLELNYFTDMYYTYDDNSMAAFYAGWCFIAFALVIGSVRSNFLYILQVLTCFAFFLLRAIGEGCGSRPTKFHAAGILEVISGFFSLFVGISQIINNETCYRMCIPTCPMSPDNEIDMLPPYLMIPGAQPPATAPPVVPVQPVNPVVPVLAQPPVVPVDNPVIPVDPPVVPVEQQVPNI
jgi:succinate-acetate transporter protein